MSAALFAAAALAACPVATQADVEQTFSRWMAAYQARDLAGVMSIFDDRIVFAFQGSRDMGRAELEANFRAEFSAPRGDSRWVPVPEAVLVSGDLANVVSTWRQEVTRDGAMTVAQTNRALDVLQRGPDCQWRITRSLNYPVKPAA